MREALGLVLSAAQMRVCVLVLNYNNLEDTAECIESVLSSDDDVEVVLVDNGSDRKVFFELRKRFRGINFLRLERNYGFARGYNAAMQRYIDRADYIFILNNDAVVERDTVGKLVECMERNPDVAACQPVVKYHGKNGIWSAGTQLFLGYPRLYMKGRNSRIQSDFEPPFGLVGCALMFRASALKDVGLFDESLFMMHEETDWCIRAKKRGYRLMVCSSSAYHKVSKTVGLFSRSYLYYIARNWILVARRSGIGLFIYALLTEPLRVMYYLTRLRDRRDIVHYLRGLRDGVMGVRGRIS